MSQKISVIIVDDDAGGIRRLRDDLAAFPEMEVVATCSSPDIALKTVVREQPDILFLDVEMPGMTGFELLKKMQPELHPDIKVVFYTAHNHVVLEALRASAFDFLLKPYIFEELKTIIDRYHSTAPETSDGQSLNKSPGQDKNLLAIQTFSGLMMVSCERVLLFDFAKELRCWQMMLIDSDKPQRLRQSITARELLTICDRLVQISKECIVNMNYISTIENKSLQCRFCHPYHNIERTASHRYFRKVRERLEIF